MDPLESGSESWHGVDGMVEFTPINGATVLLLGASAADSQEGQHFLGGKLDHTADLITRHWEERHTVRADLVEALDLGGHLLGGTGDGEVLYPLIGHPVAHGLVATTVDESSELLGHPVYVGQGVGAERLIEGKGTADRSARLQGIIGHRIDGE